MFFDDEAQAVLHSAREGGKNTHNTRISTISQSKHELEGQKE